jgi:hypothetical protein
MIARCTRVLLLGLFLAGAGAAPAAAHQGGKAELFVTDVTAEPAGAGSAWVVSVHLADADSGRPSPAFSVLLAATGPAGESVPATTLRDLGTGEYRGRLEGAAGAWSLTVRARELPGGEPAIPVEKTWNLTLDAAAPARRRAPPPRRPAAGPPGPAWPPWPWPPPSAALPSP